MKEEALRNKLQAYAPEPPERVWEKLAGQLEGAGWEERLRQYAEQPPATGWESLAANLPSNKKAPSIVRRLVPYAAAAVLLAAWIMIRLSDSAPRTQQEPDSPALVDRQQRPSSPANEQEVRMGNETQEPVHKTASVALYNSSLKNRTSSGLRAAVLQEEEADRPDFIPAYATPRRTVNNAAALEKYMVYSDGNGAAMRLPRKLFAFMTCVKENLLCQQQMAALQSKVAAAPLHDDFTGVLEILRDLKENQ